MSRPVWYGVIGLLTRCDHIAFDLDTVKLLMTIFVSFPLLVTDSVLNILLCARRIPIAVERSGSTSFPGCGSTSRTGRTYIVTSTGTTRARSMDRSSMRPSASLATTSRRSSCVSLRPSTVSIHFIHPYHLSIPLYPSPAHICAFKTCFASRVTLCTLPYLFALSSLSYLLP